MSDKKGNFLQSVCWEELQKAYGREVFRVEEEGISGLFVFHKLPLVGGYFYCPRGPIFDLRIANCELRKIQIFVSEVIKKAKENKAGWVRIEPGSGEELELIKKEIEGKYKLVKAKKDHQPKETLVMDLRKGEEELLKEMKGKARYNIRLAEKKKVEIFEARTKEEQEEFLKMIEQMSDRKGIVAHPVDYYRKMFEVVPRENLRLFLAKHEGDVLAGALVSFFGGTATYLHGASSEKKKNLMAPFLLHWKVIKKAKEEGSEKYDWGGTKTKMENGEVVPREGSWQGITRFKLGFVPKTKPTVFPGCYDIILNRKKYFFYRFLQKAKDLMK